MNLLAFKPAKDALYYARTSGTGKRFAIRETKRIALDPTDWRGLLKTVKALIKTTNQAVKVDAITAVRCSTGRRFSASAQAIKAECVLQIVADELGIPLRFVAAQSFPSALHVPKGGSWQDRAAEMFNPDGSIKDFDRGLDAAIAAAFKIAHA